MFYEVRVYNKEGKLKDTHSRDELSRRHWKGFSMKLSPLGGNKWRKMLAPVSQDKFCDLDEEVINAFP